MRNCAIYFCTILASISTLSAQQLSAVQRAEIERLGRVFIDGINENDTEATVRLLYAARTLSDVGVGRLAGQFNKVREMMGRLEYHHSEVSEYVMSTGLSRILHVYARQPGAVFWNDFQFRLESAPPFKITELAFVAEVAEPVFLPHGRIDDANTLSWLKSHIDKLEYENELSGSVLIARGDRILFEQTYGYADAARSIPISPETRFNVGSGNKMFTVLAVAILVGEKKLRYSDPLGKFLPGILDTASARKVTIHHLLTHTSGIGEYWTSEYEKYRNQITDLQDYIPWIRKAGMQFEPGTRFSYSNSNFLLAGLIIENVTGKNYYSFIAERITKPVNMMQTDFYFRDDPDVPLASPLQKEDSRWVVAAQNRRGSSAGGAYSTARDLWKFSRGLANGKILSADQLKPLVTSQTSDLTGVMNYGYGFILTRDGAVRSWGHGGTARGVNMEFRYFPDEDLTLVIFCNQDNGAHDTLKNNIVKLITGIR